MKVRLDGTGWHRQLPRDLFDGCFVAMEAQQHFTLDGFQPSEQGFELFAFLGRRHVEPRASDRRILTAKELWRALLRGALIEVAVEGDAHDPGVERPSLRIETRSRAQGTSTAFLPCVVGVEIRACEPA